MKGVQVKTTDFSQVHRLPKNNGTRAVAGSSPESLWTASSAPPAQRQSRWLAPAAREVPSLAAIERVRSWTTVFPEKVDELRWSSDVELLEEAALTSLAGYAFFPGDRISRLILGGAALERLFEIVNDCGHTWSLYLSSKRWAPKTTNNFRRIYCYWQRADLKEQVRISELGVGEILDRIRGFRRKPLRTQTNHAPETSPQVAEAGKKPAAIPPYGNVQPSAGTTKPRSMFHTIAGLLGFFRR